MKRCLSLLLAFGLTATISAQEFTQAAREANQRREAANLEYAAMLAEISPQKAELGARLAILEEQLRTLQQEFQNASRISQTLDVEVNQLESRINNLRDNNSYIQQTLLTEYIRRFELQLDPAEQRVYGPLIRTALESVDAEEGVEISDADIFRAQLTTINASIDHMRSAFGGHLIEGSAIIDQKVVDGAFALFGPLTYFSSPDGQAGIVNGVVRSSMLANVYPLPEYARQIADAVAGRPAELPLDTTGTSRSGGLQALDNLSETLTLRQEWAAGGFVMYFILGIFALAILVSAFKFVELFSVRGAKDSDLQAVLGKLRSGDYDGALAYAKKIGGPAGQMLVSAVEHADDDKEVIEEVLYETIVKTQPRLERFLAFIAVTAATAPLLGLLGTVTGMIKTFKLITIVGTGDAKSLSSGISEALITTKWGLIVAIPTLISHALLNRKAKGVIGSLEQTGVGFINGLAEIRAESDEQA